MNFSDQIIFGSISIDKILMWGRERNRKLFGVEIFHPWSGMRKLLLPGGIANIIHRESHGSEEADSQRLIRVIVAGVVII